MATSKPSPEEELIGALKQALRATPDRPHCYALVVKGPSGGRLLVSRKKIPPKLIAEVRKDVGSQVVVKGVCYGDGPALVFESPEDPQELWSKVARNLAKLAGLNLNTAFKKGRDDSEGEGDEPSGTDTLESGTLSQETGASPDTAHAGVHARIVQGFSKLLPQVKAFGNPTLIQAAKLAAGLIHKGDVAGAQRALDALTAAMAKVGTGAPPKTGASPDKAVQAWKQARQDWLDANDRLNEQLEALRVAILAHADSEPDVAGVLAEIADKGLNALTGDHRVRLMAAVHAVGQGEALAIKAHGAKALSAATAFKEHLASNEKVDACEDNPWDVPVVIRGTLDPALDRIAQVLRAGLAP